MYTDFERISLNQHSVDPDFISVTSNLVLLLTS